jgi:integrase/recombinase XerD
LISVRGKGGRDRTVKIGHEAARRLDRYLRARAGHELAYRPELWLGVGNRGPLNRSGLYQLVVRRGEECGVRLYPHRFRHHFSHTWQRRGVATDATFRNLHEDGAVRDAGASAPMAIRGA